MAGAPQVFLNRIVTRVPPTEMHGRFLALIPRLIRDERERRVFQRLSQKAQIESRYSVLKVDPNPNSLDAEGFYVPGRFPSTAQRMKVFEREAIRLAKPAVDELLERIPRDSITHLIVTNCTGSYAPGLDLEIQARCGLRSNVERTMIGFMGCYAAINGLKTAWHIVRSQPDARVLMVNLELCSLHLQEPLPGARADFEQLLAFLQFADGCAASIISADRAGLSIERFQNEVLPEGADLIQWHVGDQGFTMRLDLEVPAVLGRSLPRVWPHIMDMEERWATRLWAVHPGGRAILDAVQEALELNDQELGPSREVLRKFGNMSSATIMFVLKTFLDDARYSGKGAALAFGPGLSVETMCFNKREQ